jgi:hypothetical protein
MKHCQFQVQNLLFVKPIIAVCIKEGFNSRKQHGLWENMSLVQDHICLPLLPDATLALTIITQLIAAGNGIFGKLIVNRCIKTEGDILLSIWSYLVLLEGIILVKFGG